MIALLFCELSRTVETLPQETFKDIIRKAELLALQKDRTQATQLLISAIKKEEKQNSNRTELQRSLDQISTLFFTENAQQTYELGISLKEKDYSGAIDKLNESLRLDPKNFLVTLTIAKIYLTQFDCSKAKSQLEVSQTLNPYNSELELLNIYQAMCFKKPISVTVFKKNNQKNNPYLLNWLSLEILNQINTSNYDVVKVKEMISNLQKMDQKYPELYYYYFITDGNKQPSTQKNGEMYIKYCKELNFRKDKIYGSDPWLCTRVNEVEQQLKKGISE